MFQAVSTDVRFPDQEMRILEFCTREQIYRKSLEQRAEAPPFVFYEGPPTANGMPHPGHCLTRAIKDLFPRYRTMRGFRCERKAGWDTHGLPVEVEVCKELGIHGKDEIEKFGVEPFIQKCQQSVWRYMQEWERLTERIGFWIDLSQAYVTYHQSFVESVWWSLKNLFDRDLLYRGHKIVWWWAQGGTALSSGEVGQGYREVADPSVFVKFTLVDQPNTSLVVWTTTPWTLPSNMFAAVHPEVEYAVLLDSESGEQLVVAAALADNLAEKTKRTWSQVRSLKGAELVGWRYRPPMDHYFSRLSGAQGTLSLNGQSQRLYWRVVAADFVTLDSGTGLVHIAPAFGEVDYEILQAERARFSDTSNKPELLNAVGPDGKFTAEVPEHTGVWVKDADRAIIRQLRDSGRLLWQEQYLHDYPFCWRAEQDPLIQYPRESWFIRTTRFRDQMLENNRQIGWSPDHIRDGRFGNFLESNVDWALSRERYWGTPLPIWVCESSGKMEAIASYAELMGKTDVQGTEVWTKAKQAKPDLVDDLRVHKPYIDAITYASPFVVGARMKRVSEVIDCWYDSGAMPFAQWGYPHSGHAQFADQFPADFISEAIDQTRGWFYSQLAISTMLFGRPDHAAAKDQPCDPPAKPYPHPFKNCIVLGLMLAEWYENKEDNRQRYLNEDEAKANCPTGYVSKVGKMSKQLRNYRSPQEIFDTHGADALRWYFFASQPPWNSIIYSERAIRDSIPEFLLRMWNVLSFFTIYAEIDKFLGPASIAGSLEQLTPDELCRADGYQPIAERAELDRWILSELAQTTAEVVERMDRYDNYGACQRINQLVDGLSNWYVRRCRNRYWGEGTAAVTDKADAYWTLYEVLIELSKLVAPFVPFTAEAMWQALTGAVRAQVRQSVHLCDYPTCNPQRIDEKLSQRMLVLREIASLGRSARMDAKLKVRQPLQRVEVSLTTGEHIEWLVDHDQIVREELNVKEIAYNTGNSPYIEYQVLPNFKRLGPRVGKLLPQLKQALGAANGAQLLDQLNRDGRIRLQLANQLVELDGDDVQVRLQAKAGWTASQGKQCVVILATDLSPQLIREGLARDLVRLIQDLRKKKQCRFTDRIRVTVESPASELPAAIAENRAYIMGETLANELVLAQIPHDQPSDQFELAEQPVKIAIKVETQCR